MVEEEVISLQPIGPGVQNLEPEGALHNTSGGTLRPTTPSFPVQGTSACVLERSYPVLRASTRI